MHKQFLSWSWKI